MNKNVENIKNDDEKGNTYKMLTGKLSKAIKENFYFEAVFIEYALIEDRTAQMLYYLGLIEDYNEELINERIRIKNETNDKIKGLIKGTYKDIIEKYNSNEKTSKNKDNKPNKVYITLNNISSKINAIEAFIILNSNERDFKDNNIYLLIKNDLKKLNTIIDRKEILAFLKELRNWLDIRNQFVHDLANKNINNVFNMTNEIAVSGYKYFRQLDKYEKRIKRNIHIREKVIKDNKEKRVKKNIKNK